jgi:hypothetical protein
VSLRTRLVLAFVTLTTLATMAVGAWTYLATVDRLYAEIDRSLDDIAAIAIDRGATGQPDDAGPGEDSGGPPGGGNRDPPPGAFSGSLRYRPKTSVTCN